MPPFKRFSCYGTSTFRLQSRSPEGAALVVLLLQGIMTPLPRLALGGHKRLELGQFDLQGVASRTTDNLLGRENSGGVLQTLDSSDIDVDL